MRLYSVAAEFFFGPAALHPCHFLTYHTCDKTFLQAQKQNDAVESTSKTALVPCKVNNPYKQ